MAEKAFGLAIISAVSGEEIVQVEGERWVLEASLSI
jgi:hypothetical protein